MKYLILIAMLAMVGCSSAPRKVLMKNCDEAGKGSGLYYCEEMPKNQAHEHR